MDLLSVHVPKTAGNSFRRILVRHYGAGLVRLYHDFRPGVDYARTIARGRRAGAVHGHVGLDPLREAFPEARSVVWFRQPVDRLLSYFDYWTGLRPHGNPLHDRFMAGERTPERLAELLAGELAGYLGATPVEGLGFVGLVERFDEDAERFERWLASCGLPSRPHDGWRDRAARWLERADQLRAPHANRTRRRRPPPDPERRARLAEILADEVALYRRACRRRERDAGELSS